MFFWWRASSLTDKERAVRMTTRMGGCDRVPLRNSCYSLLRAHVHRLRILVASLRERRRTLKTFARQTHPSVSVSVCSTPIQCAQVCFCSVMQQSRSDRGQRAAPLFALQGPGQAALGPASNISISVVGNGPVPSE